MTATNGPCIKQAGSRWTNCGCDSCRKYRNRIQKLRRNHALPAIQSDAAWRRIDDLLAAGWTITSISDAAGIPFQAAWCAITRRESGTQKYLSYKNSVAILTIPTGETTRPGWYNNAGICRRLQALGALGWSAQAILDQADELGVEGGLSPDTLNKIRRGGIGRVEPRTANFVRAMYPLLSGRRAPAGQSAGLALHHAAKGGWFPPAAWDDDQIDELGAKPMTGIAGGMDEARVLRCADGRLHALDLTIAEREAAVAILHRQGMSDRQIADRTQATDRTVHRIRKRLGLTANTVESYGQVAG